MKLNSPIPQDLIAECQKCAKIIDKFAKPENGNIDQVIPPDIIANAQGIAIMTVVKAGFVWSGRAGSGLVVSRLENGEWSAPSAIGTAGMGFGGQIGAELTDFVIILNTPDAVKAFSMGGNVTLGGNLSVAAGPYGRTAEAGGAIGKLAPIYSYSKTKGLFAGISIEGSVIIERKDANAEFYGKKVSAKELLSGQIETPAAAFPLHRALNRRIQGKENNFAHHNETNESRNSFSSSNRPNLSRTSLSANNSNPPAYSTTERKYTPTRPPPPLPPNRPKDLVATALYDFKAERSTDLAFKEGDTVVVTSKQGVAEGWWIGKCNGRQGDFEIVVSIAARDFLARVLMKIGGLLYQGCSQLDLLGPLSIFYKAIPDAQFHLISESLEPVETDQLTLYPTHTYTIDLDMLIVPGGLVGTQLHNKKLLAYLKSLKCRLFSVSSGSALLGQAGTLDNKKATTNTRLFSIMKLYGAANYKPYRYIVDGDVVTSAGGFAGIDAALSLVKESGFILNDYEPYEFDNMLFADIGQIQFFEYVYEKSLLAFPQLKLEFKKDNSIYVLVLGQVDVLELSVVLAATAGLDYNIKLLGSDYTLKNECISLSIDDLLSGIHTCTLQDLIYIPSIQGPPCTEKVFEHIAENNLIGYCCGDILKDKMHEYGINFQCGEAGINAVTGFMELVRGRFGEKAVSSTAKKMELVLDLLPDGVLI
ncbi:hypothetical protein HDV01_002180 [Terramyces sp. JEL0728]|nr:hypothetical protein HDV01_002180 [Terramyces sp. JEL0728]